MGDAASVERVNILVDIVISVVLKRLNSDLETVVDVWCVRPCASSAWRLWSVVWAGLCLWLAVRASAAGDPGPGRRERCAEGECVLSFYFTNNNPGRKRKE